ncbi:MAG: RnfH family protein [Arenicellales bacterium]
MLEIIVVYALPERQFQEVVNMAPRSTVRDAVLASGVLEVFSEIDLETVPVGIFSRRVDLDTQLTDGDRVEIYRRLQLSPTEARRLRAQRKKVSRPKG